MSLNDIKKDVLRFIGNLLLANGINLIFKTLRFEIENNNAIDELRDNNKNYIIAFWHGTMLAGWFLNRSKNSSGLISKSKDGELLTKLLYKWEYNIVRGSSNDGGKQALMEMIKLVNKNNNLAITPDGPKGPAHKLKAGVVISAKRTGAPIILAGIGYKRKYTFKKSWDKFELPMMFTKVKVVYSDPIFVSKTLSYDETNEMIINCEKKLEELQKEAQF